jgi:hypothetical protein
MGAPALQILLKRGKGPNMRHSKSTTALKVFHDAFRGAFRGSFHCVKGSSSAIFRGCQGLSRVVSLSACSVFLVLWTAQFIPKASRPQYSSLLAVLVDNLSPSCIKFINGLLDSGCAVVLYPPTTITNIKLFAFQGPTTLQSNMNSISSPSAPLQHGSRAPLILGFQSSFLALALLFYSMRIYSRARPAPHFLWDDFIITLSMVSVEKKHLHNLSR